MAMKPSLCVLKVNESNGMKSKALNSSSGFTDLPNDACTFYIRFAAGLTQYCARQETFCKVRIHPPIQSASETRND